MLITSSGASRSPGPASYTTRSEPGKDSLKYTLHQRTKLPEEKLDAPYRVLPSTVGVGHKYTFKGRYTLSTDSTPSPEYIPPSIGHDARTSTMHIKTRELPKLETPGPGQYNITPRIGNEGRKATMHGPKDRAPPVNSNTPGPGTYMYGIQPNRRTLPSFSIGRRLNSVNHETTPGPGTYENTLALRPNRNVGSFHMRHRSVETERSPGPATYTTTKDILAHTPRINMHGRMKELSDINDAPYRDVSTKMGQEGPKYSMRSRYTLSNESTPSVNYVPPNFGSDVTRTTIAPKYSVEHDENVPGPGQYTPQKPIGYDARKATMHGPRDRTVDTPNRSPGPSEYTPDPSPTQPRSPRFTMKGARFEPKRDPTGEYLDLGTSLTGPKYSFRGRPGLDLSYG